MNCREFTAGKRKTAIKQKDNNNTKPSLGSTYPVKCILTQLQHTEIIVGFSVIVIRSNCQSQALVGKFRVADILRGKKLILEHKDCFPLT